MSKQRLTDLSVREVSLVDRPANKGARVMLFKRADDLPAEVETYLKRQFSADDRKRLAESGAAMPDGGFPIENKTDLHNAMRAIGRAKDPAKAKAHIRARAKALGLTGELTDAFKSETLVESVVAALKTAGLVRKDAYDGDAGHAEMFDQVYAEGEAREEACALMDEVDEACCALRGSVISILQDDSGADKAALLRATFQMFTTHLNDLAPDDIEKGANSQGEPMSADLKKSLGLAETATDADVTAAVAKALADAEALKAELALAKMSKAHSDYADAKGMDADAKAAFAAKTAEERDAHIAKNPVAKSAEQTEIEKRDAEIAKLNADVTKMREAGEIAEIEKRLSGLTVIGKAEDHARTIHTLAKTDKAAADAYEALLKSNAEALAKSKLFEEVGSGAAGLRAGDGYAAVTAKAKELLQKEPALKTIEKARVEVRKRFPELATQEQEDGKRQRAA